MIKSTFGYHRYNGKDRKYRNNQERKVDTAQKPTGRRVHVTTPNSHFFVTSQIILDEF
ncbi:MAG TPA: hypothetical protein VEF04_03065 [Blastocatellia bacterium]|nr:hypothetical protein [Blastocatellia bacterium]